MDHDNPKSLKLESFSTVLLSLGLQYEPDNLLRHHPTDYLRHWINAFCYVISKFYITYSDMHPYFEVQGGREVSGVKERKSEVPRRHL